MSKRKISHRHFIGVAAVQSHHDNLWSLPLVENAHNATFFTSRIKNVPEGRNKDVDVFGIIANYSMEQWYIGE